MKGTPTQLTYRGALISLLLLDVLVRYPVLSR
jgi:hypothetical protein